MSDSASISTPIIGFSSPPELLLLDDELDELLLDEELLDEDEEELLDEEDEELLDDDELDEPPLDDEPPQALSATEMKPTAIA